MGMGPIPWNCIVEYGFLHDLEPDMMQAFIGAIRSMDHAYLEWMGKQADRNKQGDPGSKQIPGPSGRKLTSKKGRSSK